MEWLNPEDELPKLAERVVVETAEGSTLFAKRVVRPDNIQQFQWIDDHALPIRSPVVRWTRIVSSGETA